MLNKIMKAFKHLVSKREQIQLAAKEFEDLPMAFSNLKGILASMKTLPGELKSAISDGKISTVEAANIEGRISDLVASGESVVKEIEEAVDAFRTLIP